MRFGKQLNLFLVDGTPGGLLTAEVGGWTGHITAAPRSHMKHLLQREEASRTGVYILLGEDPTAPEGVRAYIGGENTKLACLTAIGKIKISMKCKCTTIRCGTAQRMPNSGYGCCVTRR